MTNDIQVGDLIRATHNTDPKTKVEMTVTRASPHFVEGVEIALTRSTYTFKVLERPYKMPTEKGYYTVAKSDDALNANDRWLAYFDGYTWETVGRSNDAVMRPGVFEERATQNKWTLTKLVLEVTP